MDVEGGQSVNAVSIEKINRIAVKTLDATTERPVIRNGSRFSSLPKNGRVNGSRIVWRPEGSTWL